MTTYETILVETRGRVGWITLNRPERLNTIVPPSSTQYPWGDCRSGCAGCCGDGFCAAADHSEISNANSNHPGGANVLFGDGSVRFVKSTLAINTWWALGTRSGSEVISSDSY